jgi:hypothetical protein
MTKQEIGSARSAGSRDFGYLDSRPLDDALGYFNRQSHVLWYHRLDVSWVSCLGSESRQGVRWMS